MFKGLSSRCLKVSLEKKHFSVYPIIYMSKKREKITQVPETTACVDVVLHESNLKGGYGSIACKKVCIDDIIDDLEKRHNLCIDKETMKYVANVFSSQFLKALEEGKAIDLFGLGTLSPCIKGNAKLTDTPSVLREKISTSFNPSKKATDAVKHLKIKSIRKQKKRHYILYIRDILDEKSEKLNTVSNRSIGIIKGKDIKLDDDLSGIYIAKISRYGTLPPESEWKKLTCILENTASTIKFYVNDFDVGTYFFIVETSYNGGGKRLKNKVRLVSNEVQILEKRES